MDENSSFLREEEPLKGLVLSIFPGADLLGKGFEAEGFCVVRGPEKILGGDIREFNAPRSVFVGVIGGPPCQDFSRARRTEPTGYGREMLGEFCRVIDQAQPEWWLCENVPCVPDIHIPGYRIQRFDLRADECGLPQARLRHFQFGGRPSMAPLVIPRGERIRAASHTVTASEGRRKERRSFETVCELQGVPVLESEWLTRAGRYGVVGNGVPVPMARVIARAIIAAGRITTWPKVCACGCAREVTGRRTLATAACRKRVQVRRDRAGVNEPGSITIEESLL